MDDPIESDDPLDEMSWNVDTEIAKTKKRIRDLRSDLQNQIEHLKLLKHHEATLSLAKQQRSRLGIGSDEETPTQRVL